MNIGKMNTPIQLAKPEKQIDEVGQVKYSFVPVAKSWCEAQQLTYAQKTKNGINIDAKAYTLRMTELPGIKLDTSWQIVMGAVTLSIKDINEAGFEWTILATESKI